MILKNTIHRIGNSFTIIEISVALAVIGTVLGGGLTAYKMSNPKLKNDLSKMQKIEEALQVFFNTNGRLPYPAYYKDTTQSENYLKENSDNIKEINTQQETETIENKILFGVIPTRTLGLSDDYAYDSYGKNIEYIINSSLAEKIGNENNNYKKTNYNTNRDGQYAISYANKDDEKDIVMVAPKLSVKSIKNNQIMTNNAGYILISKQKQNNCYISARTNQVNENIPSNDEKLQNNCFANENIEHFYQGYSNDFDEIVMFMGLNEMVYSSANTNEAINEMTQGNIIQYQPRISKKLTTEKKDIIAAINEVNNKFQIVRVLDKSKAEEDVLYYLTKDTDDYNAGLYVWNAEDEDFESVGGGSGDGSPVGTIISYGGKEIPYGYLLCDGKNYNRTIYKELFDVIGTTYGAGDGSTTFAVPDLNQRFIEGTTADEQVGAKIAPGIPNITGCIYGQYNVALTSFAGALYAYQYHGHGFSGGGGSGTSWCFDANRGAVAKNIYRNDVSTVQPASLRMKYLIKYTKKQEKKKDENVLPPKSKLSPQDIEFICEAMYPIGSVYINYIDARNPRDILLCGTWERINAGAYLINEGQNNINKGSYSNYNAIYIDDATANMSQIAANHYIKPGVPNLYGEFEEFNVEGNEYPSGVMREIVSYGYNEFSRFASSRPYYNRRVKFDANMYNGIYGSGNLVVPYSFVVIMWIRTA